MISIATRGAILARCLLVMIICVAANEDVSVGREWNQFRGPDGNARANVNTPNDVTQRNTLWNTMIPGTGWSSPVVSGGKIWITTAETTAATPEQIAAKTRGVQFAESKTVADTVRLSAICVDAQTGKILHNRLLREISDPDLINPLNSYASPTPAITNGRVICHFGSYGTWCLDVDSGETLWRQALVVDHSVGPGSSPIISGQVVLVTCDGIDKQFVAGLELATGDEVWRTNRPGMRTSNGEFKKAYSTPLLIQIENRTQAIIPGAQWVCAYDPSSGTEIWRADCGDGFSTTPMAVFESGLLICSIGFTSGELVAIDPDGAGDISDKIVWRQKKGGSMMPTAVASGGRIFSVADNGILSVLDAATGNVQSRTRIGSRYSSSPLLVGQRLYVGNHDGEFSVYDVGEAKPKKLATSQLDGSIMASPAIIDSDLIIRTSKSLMRVRAAN